jgi:hypothetical protein
MDRFKKWAEHEYSKKSRMIAVILEASFFGLSSHYLSSLHHSISINGFNSQNFVIV